MTQYQWVNRDINNEERIMWILATWLIVAIIVAMVFGSMARRSSNYTDREITTKVAGGEHSHLTK